MNEFVIGFFVQEHVGGDIVITDSRCLDKGRMRKYIIVQREAGWKVCKNNTFYSTDDSSTFTLDYVLFNTKRISQIIDEINYFFSMGCLV